ncbi:MAG: 4-hydroxy-tetrahydrodipicolinate synthase [Chitinophagales bacterium]
MHSYSKDSISKFTGTGVALVTPFKTDGSIDWQGLEALIHHVIMGKVEFVVSMGTTGEAATLSEAERFSIIDFTVKTVNGKIPVVAGFGGNNTQALKESIGRYHFNGVDAILSASPYYNKPTQEGIYHHYMAIDSISPLPIILYNVPGRTSSNIEANTTLRIAKDAKHVIAIKEASGNFVQCMRIIQGADPDFLVVSGDDIFTMPMLAFGMHGVISVVANYAANDFSEMVRCGIKGDFITAQSLHYKLLDFMELIFKEGNPGGIKSALKHGGICGDSLRLPLWKVSDELDNKIQLAVAEINN